jgi:Domain of unknown function (DUF3846)
MKAVAIRIDGTVEEFDQTYETIKERVGGWLEIAPTPGSPFVMFCDEEGKLKGLPVNVRANALANQYRDWEDPICGPVVLVGLPDGEGENTEFTLAELERAPWRPDPVRWEQAPLPADRDAAAWARDARP